MAFLVMMSRSRPAASCISISTACAPRAVKYSITSRPTAPAPTTAMRLPLISVNFARLSIMPVMEKILPFSTSMFSRKPSMGGSSGVEPVALTIRCGRRAETEATSARLPICSIRLSSEAIRFFINCGKSAMRFFSGRREISLARPPTWFFASSSQVWQPTSAAVQAASIPAVPAPMTTTLVSRFTRRIL